MCCSSILGISTGAIGGTIAGLIALIILILVVLLITVIMIYVRRSKTHKANSRQQYFQSVVCYGVAWKFSRSMTVTDYSASLD